MKNIRWERIKLTIGILIVGAVVVGWALSFFEEAPRSVAISDFESCAAEGYPIFASYPRQCRASDGQNFMERVPREFPDRVACIQVITPARNPVTGEVIEFPTPCDVPPGWETLR